MDRAQENAQNFQGAENSSSQMNKSESNTIKNSLKMVKCIWSTTGRDGILQEFNWRELYSAMNIKTHIKNKVVINSFVEILI